MRISHSFIHVLDQDEALDFYVGKLGMVVHTDADLGVMRFLTVNFPDQPDVELVLMVPGPTARCAIPSGTRSASPSRRTGQSSCHRPRSSKHNPDECVSTTVQCSGTR